MALLASRRLRVAAVAVAAASLIVTARLRAQAQPPVPPAPIEANLKAVFLFNFSKYVSWPPIAMGERSPAELRICVTANDSFFALLKAAVQGEDVDGKPMIPVALEGLDDAKTCQILYIGDPQTLDAKAWLSAVRDARVLTVADGALADEVVIAFVRDNNRIRFDINRQEASRRGLNISAKLLRLARQVKDR